MAQTIFEKIINREIPAEIWYEDDNALAFMDINPVTFGHSLLITKAPYPWIQDVPPAELGQLFEKVPDLIKRLKKATGCDFVKLAVVGTDVPHFHLHLIPLKHDDKDAHDAAPNPRLKSKDRAELLNLLKSS